MQMHKIDVSWVDDRLKRISAQLIEAHRAGNETVIAFYASQAGIAANGPVHSKRLFMRVIQVFHPDRSGVFMQRISDCESRGDETGLTAIRKLLEVGQFAANAKNGFTADRASAGRTGAERHYGAERYTGHREEYGYDEEDFDDTEYEDASDYENESYDDEDREEFFEGSFLEALKRELFGNLDIYPDRAEIEQMEGELDLSDYGINDLSGVEYCRNIVSLNLALNDIDNIWPLRGLVQLEYLDLSSNDLDDADELASLVNLKEIDLSFNNIDDMRFLEKMVSLTAVGIAGNPVKDPDVLNRLRARGVMIIA